MVGSALYAAISGLKSQQVKLDVIANNVANLNTFGYKSSRVAFSDLLSQTLRAGSAPQAGRGGTNPIQVGVGVQLAAIDTIITQGSIQTTGNLTDLAINGEGYFIVSDGTALVYTRAGNFTLDADGALITSNGFRVQGWAQLTTDNSAIDTSRVLEDIIVNFGEKLPGRATTTANYVSNLDASSYTFGSAELLAPGSTGIQVAAGIALPIASFTGAEVDDTAFPLADATSGELQLNGQDIDLDFTAAGFVWAGATSDDVAQFIAEQINLQSPTIYARAGTNGNVILQNLFGGEGNDIIIAGNVPYLTDIGLTAGTYEAPDPASNLAGTHTITITDAVAASGTSTTPVQYGDLTGDTIQIMGLVGGVPGAISITYPSTVGLGYTSAQNAQVIADAINAENAANPGFFISANANANGTITLTSDFPGLLNEIIIVNPGTLDTTGLDTIGTQDPITLYYVTANGSDATATNVFLSHDGTVTWTRTFADATPFGQASSLDNLGPRLIGENPPLPLIPGVTLTAESIFPGQATIFTYDAFEHQTSINVYDSMGTPHQLTLIFQHTDSNEWEWTASLPNEPQYTLLNASGTIEFSSAGLIITANPANPITFQPAGADPVQVYPIFNGLGNPINGITQFAATSTTAAESQDGYAMGTLQAFAFDPSGTLQGVYSNGLTRPLARLALAVFSNPAGLQRIGDNMWAAGGNSGLPLSTPPREGGAGEILGGSLEQSNVDAATEFTELIVAQRSFQACSRIITAQDEILQEVVNLVR